MDRDNDLELPFVTNKDYLAQQSSSSQLPTLEQQQRQLPSSPAHQIPSTSSQQYHYQPQPFYHPQQSQQLYYPPPPQPFYHPQQSQQLYYPPPPQPFYHPQQCQQLYYPPPPQPFYHPQQSQQLYYPPPPQPFYHPQQSQQLYYPPPPQPFYHPQQCQQLYYPPPPQPFYHPQQCQQLYYPPPPPLFYQPPQPQQLYQPPPPQQFYQPPPPQQLYYPPQSRPSTSISFSPQYHRLQYLPPSYQQSWQIPMSSSLTPLSSISQLPPSSFYQQQSFYSVPYQPVPPCHQTAQHPTSLYYQPVSMLPQLPPSSVPSVSAQRQQPFNGNIIKKTQKRKATRSSASSSLLQQPPRQPQRQLRPPPPLQQQQPAQGQHQQVQAGLFPQSYLKDDFGKSIVYPQLLESALPEIVWPVLGTIFKIEHKFYVEVEEFGKAITCQSKFFHYKYHNAELLINKANITPEVFVWSDFYDGKGEKNRNMIHLDDHFKGKGKCPDKNHALEELIANRKTGVMVSLHNPFSSEWLSLCREGGQIELLRGQVCNKNPGEFPGIEHVIGSEMYRPGERGSTRLNPREFLFDKNEMTKWGIYTLARSYHAFMQQNHFVIDGSNLYDVVKAVQDAKIQNTDNDNQSLYSLKNLITPNIQEFSSTLTGLMNRTRDGNLLFDNVWNTTFRQKTPQQCFVFVIFDGKKVPIPFYKKDDTDLDYAAIKDDNDVLITDFKMPKYLDAVVGIGYENNLNRFYEFFKAKRQSSNLLQQKVQELLKSEDGIFIQVVFSIASEDDTKLKKAVMLGAMKNNLVTTAEVDEAGRLSGYALLNKDDFNIYGASCWFRAYQHFLAEPPSRLSRRHFTATRLKWN